MVNSEKACSTLWENWNYEIGTKNHAWSGGPLIIMSKYFAGIEPLEKGYDVISIKPQFGKLKRISAETTTIKGDISLEAKKADDEISIKIKVPSKTFVAIPKVSGNMEIKMNGKIVYKNQESKKNKIAQYDSQDESFVYFYVEAGEYEIEGK